MSDLATEAVAAKPLAITLAGESYPVRKLTLAQNIEMQDGLCRVLAKIEAGADARALSLTSADLSDMGDIIFAAVSRTNPDMTRDAFNDLEITPLELVSAIGVVMVLAGYVADAAA